MRTTLFSVLAILALRGIPADAQSPAGPLSARPPATNRYLAQPTTKRFFFTSDPKTIGQPAVFGRPATSPGTNRFLRPYAIAAPVPQAPTLKFPLTGLRPLAGQPPQDFRRFLKPTNTRLFFFSKP